MLLSGGADSAVVLASAVRDGFGACALTIDYGQRHRVELEMASAQAKLLNAEKHLVITTDLRAIGSSALTDDIEVPLGRSQSEISSGIPITYVPARNTLFLSLALGWAETLGTGDIFIGVNFIDYSGYPDCRPEFLQSFEQTADLATKMGVEGKQKIKNHAPLIKMTKAEIFKMGVELGVDFYKTHSCYDPKGEKACGRCDSCLIRKKGFDEAGLKDPLDYASGTPPV